jgi:hypothetical protein
MMHVKTKDPTQQSIEAAILDQKVAGTMGDDPYAYVAVLNHRPGKMWAIGIAVEDQAGYVPIEADIMFTFDRREEVDAFVGGMNKHIGLTPDRAARIVISSMRGKVVASY